MNSDVNSSSLLYVMKKLTKVLISSRYYQYFTFVWILSTLGSIRPPLVYRTPMWKKCVSPLHHKRYAFHPTGGYWYFLVVLKKFQLFSLFTCKICFKLNRRRKSIVNENFRWFFLLEFANIWHQKLSRRWGFWAGSSPHQSPLKPKRTSNEAADVNAQVQKAQ